MHTNTIKCIHIQYNHKIMPTITSLSNSFTYLYIYENNLRRNSTIVSRGATDKVRMFRPIDMEPEHLSSNWEAVFVKHAC